MRRDERKRDERCIIHTMAKFPVPIHFSHTVLARLSVSMV